MRAKPTVIPYVRLPQTGVAATLWGKVGLPYRPLAFAPFRPF